MLHFMAAYAHKNKTYKYSGIMGAAWFLINFLAYTKLVVTQSKQHTDEPINFNCSISQYYDII